METVDLSDINNIVLPTIDNNDKGPVSLEQIRIEESEERLELDHLFTIMAQAFCVVSHDEMLINKTDDDVSPLINMWKLSQPPIWELFFSEKVHEMKKHLTLSENDFIQIIVNFVNIPKS